MMAFIVVMGVGCWVMGVAGCWSGGSADLVIYGKIFTAEAGQLAEAFAVKDGKYIYVGDKAGAEAFVDEGRTEIVDYNGRGLVMPGCGNGHAHYMMGYALLTEQTGTYVRSFLDNEGLFPPDVARGSMRKIEEQLLAEVQRIKSTGDYEAARRLIEDYGVKVDPVLHQEVLERYKKLDLAPYKGFVNPKYELVKDADGNVIDVKVTYDESYVEQMLRYSKDYRTL